MHFLNVEMGMESKFKLGRVTRMRLKTLFLKYLGELVAAFVSHFRNSEMLWRHLHIMKVIILIQ